MDTAENSKLQQNCEPQNKANGILVCGILSVALSFFTFGIASLIFAIIALKDAKRLEGVCSDGEQKKVEASRILGIIGLVISIVILALMAIGIIMALIAIVTLGFKAVVNIVVAILSTVLSMVVSALGIAIAGAIEQLIVAIVEGIVDGVLEGMAAIMFIL